MSVRDVVFLGAGASGADGAPIQAQLFRDYFLQSLMSDGDMDRELASFFRDFYNIDTQSVTDTTVFPTFEDVLGMLELALLRREYFRGADQPWGQHQMQRCRDHLIFLICRVLADKLGRGLSAGDNYHRRLIANLQNLRSTCFISLNYDLLIDNAIRITGRVPHYATDFANPIHRYNEPIFLYKLHGSLNWLRCPMCGSLTQTGDEKAASYPDSERPRCANSKCEAPTTPIVIPPTFLKVMDDFHLQQIWHHAERALVEAERIIFCGYSLPDADLHIRYLLKRAEINRGTTPDVVVINNHAGKEARTQTDEKIRYEHLFRQPFKVKYTGFSFEEFANSGLAMLD